MTPMSYAAGGMGLAALIGWGMFFISDAKLDTERAVGLVKDQQIVDLGEAIKGQKDVVGMSQELAKLGVDVAQRMGARAEAADRRTRKLEGRIDQLRATEERNAINDPEGRALASRERLCDIMRQASSSGSIEGCLGANDDTPDDQGGTRVPTPEIAVGDGGDNGQGELGGE